MGFYDVHFFLRLSINSLGHKSEGGVAASRFPAAPRTGSRNRVNHPTRRRYTLRLHPESLDSNPQLPPHSFPIAALRRKAMSGPGEPRKAPAGHFRKELSSPAIHPLRGLMTSTHSLRGLRNAALTPNLRPLLRPLLREHMEDSSLLAGGWGSNARGPTGTSQCRTHDHGAHTTAITRIATALPRRASPCASTLPHCLGFGLHVRHAATDDNPAGREFGGARAGGSAAPRTSRGCGRPA